MGKQQIRKEAYLAGKLENPEMIYSRNGYGEGLVEAGRKNKNVIALCADLTDSTRTEFFRKEFPDRFVEMGVAEQNLATIASGMAAAGKIPFISSYAVFSPGRNWEQIRTTISYNNQPVKIAGAHAGISVGPDGATHQAIEDIATMRMMVNMVVMVPCDWLEAKKATIAAAKNKSPCYMRFGREKVPVVTTEKTPFKIGRAEIYRNGCDVAVIACGPLVYEALVAAKQLEKEGIQAMVINNHTIKPIDKTTLIEAAMKCNAVVTAEEHLNVGGLGGAVAEVLTESYPVPIRRVGIKNRFGQSGTPSELMVEYGLKSQDIIRAVHEVLQLKSGLAACRRCDNNQAFRMEDKHLISIEELERELEHMPLEIYKKHVNKKKNDFASWINDVFHNPDLAAKLRDAKGPKTMLKAIRTYLKR